MADLNTSDTKCAENIALLYHLGQVVCEPQRNPVKQAKTDASRTLPLQDERDLVSALAFFSSIRVDPNKVSAVCVHEEPPGLVVMVAANAKGDGSSSDYLEKMRQGFEKIFSSLKGAPDNTAARVLQAVISMCRSRILTRARFKDRGDKPTIQSLLDKVLVGMKQLPTDGSRRDFIDLGSKLASKMNEFQEGRSSSEPGPLSSDDNLGSIVSAFHDISRIPNLERILCEELGSDIGPPSLLPGLLNTIRKLGKYQSSANTLEELSKRHPIVGNASIRIVTLGSLAFSRPLPGAPPRDFDLKQKLKALKRDRGSGWDVDDLIRKLSQTFKNDTEQFKKQFKEMTSHPKVHAEIQLAWYVDKQQHFLNPPRVITSNKDACFLCNAFLLFHGEYIIPRTHGRIYPGWRLPSTGFGGLSEGFPQELERLAAERIDLLIRDGFKKIQDPTESTVSSVVAVKAAQQMGVVEEMEQTDELLQESDSDATVVPERHDSTSQSPSTPTQQSQDCAGVVVDYLEEEENLVADGQIPPTSGEVEDISHAELVIQEPTPPPPPPIEGPPNVSPTEQLDEGVSPVTDSQTSSQHEHLENSRLSLKTNSPPSIGSQPEQVPSLETGQTRPSSTSAGVLADVKPAENTECDSSSLWTRVESGKQKIERFPGSLHLHVEYMSSLPSKGRFLRFRAQQLSEEEAMTAVKEDTNVYDLSELNQVEPVQSWQQIKMRVGRRVFVVDLDDFVPPATTELCTRRVLQGGLAQRLARQIPVQLEIPSHIFSNACVVPVGRLCALVVRATVDLQAEQS
ncbi:hypothetical protein FALBO_4681 [Fusarium albosuccineum]|uniref:Uncharacterized protein n=1 Tax=Fusarium albosuccineum TaxID=1237068 RepID=A0A8H4LIA7_9HYPO|nr:hypothetical protein FALBO_4681 [Fusarium albosuccineum]